MVSKAPRRSHLYILNGKEVVPVTDVAEWCRWRRAVAPVVVGRTETRGCLVSTVFLGMDHGSDCTRPLLFETMILGGRRDGRQWRYSTWDEAEEGHARVTRLVRDDVWWRRLAAGVLRLFFWRHTTDAIRS